MSEKFFNISPSGELSLRDDLTSEELLQLESTTRLNFDGKDITSIKKDTFNKLSALQQLNLSYNQLTSLPADIFKNLTKLEYLSLAKNKLPSLPADIFKNLTKLEQLFLSDNQLTELPQGIFDNLPNLKRLYLLNNKLTELHQDTFNKLSALEWGSLLSNPTTTLEITLLNYNIYTSEFVDKELPQTLKANIQIEKFNRYSNLKTFIYTGSDNIKIPPEIEANLDTIITPNKVKLDLTKKPSSFLISGIEAHLANKLKPEIERLKKEYTKITDFNFENLEGRSIEELTEITLFVDKLRHEEKAIIGFFFQSAFKEHERTVNTEKDEFWNNYYTGSINDVDKKADAFIIINISRSLQISKKNQNNALVNNPETTADNQASNPETTDATAADKETKAPINLNSNAGTPNQQNLSIDFNNVISSVTENLIQNNVETEKTTDKTHKQNLEAKTTTQVRS